MKRKDGSYSLTGEWRLLIEGEESALRALHLSTEPDNEGYVRARVRGNTLTAGSPPMPWRSSLATLQDYLSHVKLSLRVLSLEEGPGVEPSPSGQDSC